MHDYDNLLFQIFLYRLYAVAVFQLLSQVQYVHCVPKTSTYMFVNNLVQNKPIFIILVYEILKKFGTSVKKIAHHTFKMSPHYLVRPK